ncbi:MAG: YceH family protein [Planctomycetaceae bacterium]|nr:YceH family protein [Planctomycetaceae bacterium]
MTTIADSPPSSPPDRKWQPLSSRQRRVFGVLIEKAKTTPDVYPMTINGIVAGANQKSNREPQMSLSADDVEQVLGELRAIGCVTEVQGSGRVPKYRHHAYEWLGVEKTELAVMTELLLRGEQTLGELRGRAARMEPIADLGALKPVVDSLIAKGLMIELTPAGRGQVVTHNLYKEREIGELKARFAGYVPPETRSEEDSPSPVASPRAVAASPVASAGITKDEFAELSVEVAELRAEVARLRELVSKLEAKLAAVMS